MPVWDQSPLQQGSRRTVTEQRAGGSCLPPSASQLECDLGGDPRDLSSKGAYLDGERGLLREWRVAGWGARLFSRTFFQELAWHQRGMREGYQCNQLGWRRLRKTQLLCWTHVQVFGPDRAQHLAIDQAFMRASVDVLHGGLHYQHKNESALLWLSGWIHRCLWGSQAVWVPHLSPKGARTTSRWTKSLWNAILSSGRVTCRVVGESASMCLCIHVCILQPGTTPAWDFRCWSRAHLPAHSCLATVEDRPPCLCDPQVAREVKQQPYERRQGSGLYN